jgi:glycosyltransferase involved in cell wall biosynthesis
MNVVVDGNVYEWQRKGGISRMFNEILPRVCDLDESLQISLLVEKNRLQQALPTHAHIQPRYLPTVERYLRPWRVWRNYYPQARRILRQIAAGNGRGKLWHSTYFTMPDHWRGKQIVTVHDMLYERFPHLFSSPDDQHFRIRKHHCVEAADLIICVSQATSNDVQEFYRIDEKRIRVIHHGFSPIFGIEPHAPPSSLTTDRPFILYVGDRTHYKNFATLLKAYTIWKGRAEFDLYVTGRPDWSAGEAAVLADGGLSGQVHALGFVDDPILQHLYLQAAAFVYPSLGEGFGIPLLEAMACGCPIVASRIPSTQEVAQDCPIYFEPRDVDSLIAAFDTTLAEGRGTQRVAEGLNRVKDFSWDITAQKTLAVYQELHVSLAA